MNLTVGDLLDTGVGVVMTFLDDRSRSQLKPFMPTGDFVMVFSTATEKPTRTGSMSVPYLL